MSFPILRSLRAVAAHGNVFATWQMPAVAIQSSRIALAGQQWRPSSSLPTVAQSSFWKSLVPKPLRRGEDGTLPVANVAKQARKSKEWNPATFYIFIFLFIGSMSIQMIALKRDFDTFMRQSEVKIGLLKEVVERIQKGEDVDVERILGTGEPKEEAEWELALKEIERDEVVRNSKRQDKKTAEASPPAPTAAPTYEPTITPNPQVTAGSPASVKVASATSFY